MTDVQRALTLRAMGASITTAQSMEAENMEAGRLVVESVVVVVSRQLQLGTQRPAEV